MLSGLPSWNRNIERNYVLGERLSSLWWKSELFPSVSLSQLKEEGGAAALLKA